MTDTLLENAAFLDFASINPDDLDLTQLEACAPNWQWFNKISREELLSSIDQFDLIISNKVVIDAEIVQKADRLKLICVSATGVNNVDLIAAQKKGVVVCNVQAYATASVVQHVFSLILTLATQLDESRLSVSDKRWSNSEHFSVLGIPILELQGKTIGIVGFGELGKAVAKVAESFGMKVLIAKRDADDSRDGRILLRELLPQVDVLSLHCPLTRQTQGLIGSDELALMKSSALLINTARGGLVDEFALLEALKKHRLAGAGLDVLEREPPAIDNMLINTGLKNLLITPHVAWASQESRQRLVDEVVNNIHAFITGQTRNVITHP